MAGVTRLRDKLDANQPAFGCWLGLADPALVEIVALSGYDYVNIDLEHTSTDLGMVEHMLRAAHSRNISALVRAPGQDSNTIFRIAEMGADGIYIPHVSSVDDARRAVMAAKYAPIGDRGIGGSTRAFDYGLSGEPSASHAERSNRQLILWAQIEEKSAVDQIDQIAGTDGIDVCGIAPFDLARSLGVPPSRDNPVLMQAAAHVANRVRALGKAKLGVPVTVFGAELALQLGAVAINSDSVIAALGKALRANLDATKRIFERNDKVS